MVKYKEQLISKTFYALSDETRREILYRLTKEKHLTILEIAEPYKMSLPAVSKHVKVLEECGLVNRTIDGRVHEISINTKPMQEAYSWLEYYSLFWEQKLDNLKKFVDNTEGE